ncbi:MAG: hypothetical protein DLM61_02265 [Pseudonocardiales bacterium]|nr:MAG: hypothetical protein DLM61_02265 [Pseudonocardiales bacterium]
MGARPHVGPIDPCGGDMHLPSPSADAQELPASRTEQILTEIWREVLERPDVSVRDNFFDLGGYSLLLHVVREEIVRRLGAHPRMMELFQHSTVRALARHIDGDSIDVAGRTGSRGSEQRQDARARLGRLRTQRARMTGLGQ